MDAQRNTLPIISLTLYVIAIIGLALLLDPIPQDPVYHQFADQRTLLGISHVGDVLSNLFFVAAGAAGLLFLLRGGGVFIDPGERAPFVVFFTGMLLTGFGSGWYHLAPDNTSLLLDRLPMTLVTAGFTAALVSDRLGPQIGRLLLWPLVAAGLLSALWWAWSEQLGQGDLRPYALFQYGPILPLLALLITRPNRYSHGNCYGWGFALYGLAKLAEHFDHAIYSSLMVASGHNLKHLLAAGVGVCLLWMLYRRREMTQT